MSVPNLRPATWRAATWPSATWLRTATCAAAMSIAAPLLVGLAIGGCERPPAGGLDVIPSGPDDTRLSRASAFPAGATGDEVTSWESTPWNDNDPETTDPPWLAYPAHGQLQVHHGQGRVPSGVIVYIAFVEDGQNPAVAPGDLTRIVEVNDDFVTVWNDTSSGYFARVVLLF